VEHLIEENPLAVAAGAVIVGLMFGLLLPATRRENRVLGRTRDRLVDRAGEATERVKSVASDAARDVGQTVREEWTERKPELKGTVQEAARNVADEVKDAASRVRDEAREAVRTKGRS
jgi:gas vesicle protein